MRPEEDCDDDIAGKEIWSVFVGAFARFLAVLWSFWAIKDNW